MKTAIEEHNIKALWFLLTIHDFANCGGRSEKITEAQLTLPVGLFHLACEQGNDVGIIGMIIAFAHQSIPKGDPVLKRWVLQGLAPSNLCVPRRRVANSLNRYMEGTDPSIDFTHWRKLDREWYRNEVRMLGLSPSLLG
jgi:hypothetical protein